MWGGGRVLEKNSKKRGGRLALQKSTINQIFGDKQNPSNPNQVVSANKQIRVIQIKLVINYLLKLFKTRIWIWIKNTKN